MILPASRWIDIQHLSCFFYLLSSSSRRPNETTPSVPPTLASHSWLRLRPHIAAPPYSQTLASPSLHSPHVLLFSDDVIPNPHPHPNHQPSYSHLPVSLRLHYRIFHGSCSFPSEASPSSSALVRSSRHRRLALSTWSTTERNQEMTVRGEDDSRDPRGSL